MWNYRIRSGHGRAKPLLIHGLERLEYLGYDSAGLAMLEDDVLDYVRLGRKPRVPEASVADAKWQIVT